MARRCPGNGLVLAGLIVTLIGLGIVATRALAIPRHWHTLLIGLALLGARAVWRLAAGSRGSTDARP